MAPNHRLLRIPLRLEPVPFAVPHLTAHRALHAVPSASHLNKNVGMGEPALINVKLESKWLQSVVNTGASGGPVSLSLCLSVSLSLGSAVQCNAVQCSAAQSVSPPASQPARQSVSQSNKQSVSQSISQSDKQPASQSVSPNHGRTTNLNRIQIRIKSSRTKLRDSKNYANQISEPAPNPNQNRTTIRTKIRTAI